MDSAEKSRGEAMSFSLADVLRGLERVKMKYRGLLGLRIVYVTILREFAFSLMAKDRLGDTRRLIDRHVATIPSGMVSSLGPPIDSKKSRANREIAALTICLGRPHQDSMYNLLLCTWMRLSERGNSS